MSTYLKRTAAHRYRNDILEPLLIVHDYAFHPVYAELRRAAASHRPRVQVSGEFWRRALSAHWLAKVAERNRSYPDSSLVEEWRMMASEYPRLAQIPLVMLLVAKWRAVCKSIRSWVTWHKAA